MWIEKYKLTNLDVEILLGNAEAGWLNDKHVDAINKLVSRHIGWDDDLQTSLIAQGVDGGFKPVTRDGHMRIMYDQDHWVAVAHGRGQILLADSLGSKVSQTIVLQLKQLFANEVQDDGLLPVLKVMCAQQAHGSDCGVFAAAFLYEWATTSVRTYLHVRFDIPKMREHLRQCLEMDEVVAFPKLRGSRATCRSTTKLLNV